MMIGRDEEVNELTRLYNSGEAEFVAVYGRRRVGKTYLINEALKDRITFRHTGLSPVDTDSKNVLKAQLEQFYYSLLQQGMKRSHRPASWLEAFFMLEMFLQEKDDGSRQVVFIDELPWMDTPRSGFVTALEGFWNNWCCHRHNLMLIVCGSASSWMKDKLINNHGGLYDRVTCQIKIRPFTLKECEEFFRSSNVRLSRYDITQAYMILGGIPYYLGYFQPGSSLAQNIDKLFYVKQAKLENEYDRLFSSVFDDPDYMKSIVELLYRKREGYTRKEITKGLGISDGSRLTEALKALAASDFIVRYVPFGYSKREEHYKLIDPFCIYWLHFVNGRSGAEENYWQSRQSSQEIVVWRGIAFELVCFDHIEQIKKALGINGVSTTHSAWYVKGGDTEGAQIDLIIMRSDNVVNICEIKFYGKEFRVDTGYYHVLLERSERVKENISPKMSVHNTLITTFGLVYNEYSGIFTNVITLDDLFE